MPAADHATLCLLHGWGFDNRVFAGFAEKFLPEWRVINLSLPGYNGREFNVTGIEGTARSLLPEVPVRSVLVGWSLGGMIGIRIAAMKQLSHLILLAGTPCFVKKKDWPGGANPDLIRGLAQRTRTNPGKALREFALLSSRGGGRQGATFRELTTSLARSGTRADALLDGLEILRTADLRVEFSRLPCRTGIILAEHDALVSLSMAAALQTLRPGVDLGIIEAAGHAPFISAPVQTRRVLLNMLSHEPS